MCRYNSFTIQRETMQIELYKSALCPRCAYAAYVLKRLQEEFEDLDIISYDIATDLNAFKDSKIRMIPTIKHQENVKSWFIPKAEEIREFVLKCKEGSKKIPASQSA